MKEDEERSKGGQKQCSESKVFKVVKWTLGGINIPIFPTF